jgi:hypothetical protein
VAQSAQEDDTFILARLILRMLRFAKPKRIPRLFVKGDSENCPFMLNDIRFLKILRQAATCSSGLKDEPP